MIEIERRYLLKKDALDLLFKENDLTGNQSDSSINIYLLDNPEVPLQIRTRGGEWKFALKKKVNNDTYIESQVKIEEKDLLEFLRIAFILEYKKCMVLRKNRRTFHIGDLKLDIDLYIDIELYVLEIEYTGKSEVPEVTEKNN
ncbi:MAG: CYTH domain-containing protein [Candidatus Dojkabacteria bacterium]|nr:CYTH domain-containing protein [Candidatus Dojkabacteria bacterium]